MQREAIYKGATRPAMKFGVPLVPLVVLFGSAMLVTLWGGVLVSWWTVPLVAAARAPSALGPRSGREPARSVRAVLVARFGARRHHARR
jgi:type IV secretion system protein VirB3